MFRTRAYLVLPIPAHSSALEIRELGRQALGELAARRTEGVVIDVSAVEVLGGGGFETLCRLARSIRVAGSRAVVAGFQAGVAASLVELDLELSALPTAFDVEAGVDWLAEQKRVELEGDDGGA